MERVKAAYAENPDLLIPGTVNRKVTAAATLAGLAPVAWIERAAAAEIARQLAARGIESRPQ